jgi:rubrerythrin
MSQLSEKELATIKDLLAGEDLLVKKFQMLAEHADNEELKGKMLSIADKHQGHFNELYAKLS